MRVAFDLEGHDGVLDDLGRRVSPRVLRAPARLDGVVRELEEYFAGTRHDFDVAVDLRLASGFRRQVLDRLREVPYGSTASYAALAAATGSPRAVRAVGTACATNPVPVVVPCHRVVRSDGAIGSYRGGTRPSGRCSASSRRPESGAGRVRALGRGGAEQARAEGGAHVEHLAARPPRPHQLAVAQDGEVLADRRGALAEPSGQRRGRHRDGEQREDAGAGAPEQDAQPVGRARRRRRGGPTPRPSPRPGRRSRRSRAGCRRAPAPGGRTPTAPASAARRRP